MSENVIHARVDDELKQRIVAQAAKEHRTIANFITHAILVYLDSINK